MHQQNVSQEITRHKREINKKIESGEVKASEFGEVTSNMERNNGLNCSFFDDIFVSRTSSNGTCRVEKEISLLSTNRTYIFHLKSYHKSRKTADVSFLTSKNLVFNSNNQKEKTNRSIG